jgi:hypothetical protein
MRRRFKAGVTGALLVLLAMLCGCTGMVQDELAETHAKLAALQALADSVNRDLTTLGKIAEILDKSDDLTIDPGSLKETEDGYEISFKDGKTIFIPYGKDGKDGRTLIPVGIMQAEDSLYYWTIDGKPMEDEQGNYIRAGATDGADGINGTFPQIVIEDGFWWIVFEGQDPVKIASCEELDGVGVFSGVDTSDPTKMVLKLLDGTVIEIPCQVSLKVSFAGQSMETFLIAAGELLPIPYEVVVEGDPGEPVVVTSGTDGFYFSRIVEGEQSGSGVVMVQAPEVFTNGYILLNAYCAGYSAVKMISFEERKVVPAADTVTVRLKSAGDTVKVAYSANFEYTVSCDTTWLKVIPSPADSSLTFIAVPNTADTVRTGTVTVSPKDNPDYICTTFQVMQATDAVTTEFEADSSFKYDSVNWILEAPAVGGNAIIRYTSGREIKITNESELPDWFTATLTDEGGFYKLSIDVTANEKPEQRKGEITLLFGTTYFIPQKLKITQDGKPAETGEGE